MSATSPRLPDHPFTHHDLQALGLSRLDLRHAVQAGTLRHPFVGVFMPAHLSDRLEARAASLALVVRRHQIVCDRSAAWLHGIDSFAQSELQKGVRVEICARRGHAPVRRPGVDGRTRDLLDRDIQIVGGIQTTTPGRTALDLGCHLRRREALATLDALAHELGVTREELELELPRFRRRRGVIQLRELIPLMDARAESPRESWVRLAIIDAGLPVPDLQLWVEDENGVRQFRLDHAYREAKVAVEYDGWEFHERTKAQRDRDQRRRKWLRDHGWTVIIVRKGDFTGDALYRWLDKLRDALTQGYSSRRW